MSVKGREVNDRLRLRIILIVKSIFQFIGGDICSINTAITKNKLVTCKKLLPFQSKHIFSVFLKAHLLNFIVLFYLQSIQGYYSYLLV